MKKIVPLVCVAVGLNFLLMAAFIAPKHEMWVGTWHSEGFPQLGPGPVDLVLLEAGDGRVKVENRTRIVRWCVEQNTLRVSFTNGESVSAPIVFSPQPNNPNRVVLGVEHGASVFVRIPE